MLKVRRGQGPVYSALRRLALAACYLRLPVPGFALPLFRLLYRAHFSIRRAIWRSYTFFYAEPLFRGRCERIGKRVEVWCLPEATNHTRIFVGDDVKIWGKMSVTSGSAFDKPTLVLGNRVTLGHMVQFTINQEVVIEDDVHVATHVTFADSDSHSRDPETRMAGIRPPREEIKPILVKRNAWIGHHSNIQKGVTIGEGAIVAASSTVLTDIPAFSVAMGNPARVVIKDVRVSSQRPTQQSAL